MLFRRRLVRRGRSSRRGGAFWGGARGKLVSRLQEDLKDGEERCGLDGEAVNLRLFVGVDTESLPDALDYEEPRGKERRVKIRARGPMLDSETHWLPPSSPGHPA